MSDTGFEAVLRRDPLVRRRRACPRRRPRQGLRIVAVPTDIRKWR
jgi:hypothetical protein